MNFLLKLSDFKSDFKLTLGYLNPALNNPAHDSLHFDFGSCACKVKQPSPAHTHTHSQHRRRSRWQESADFAYGKTSTGMPSEPGLRCKTDQTKGFSSPVINFLHHVAASPGQTDPPQKEDILESPLKLNSNIKYQKKVLNFTI